MHSAVNDFLAETVDTFGPFRRVTDYGGRDVNGTCRPHFPGATYTAVDLYEGPGVDVVMDAALYEAPELQDCIVCTEVLEHTPNPGAIVASAYRNLCDGGLFIVTCAMDCRAPHSAIREGDIMPGEFYRNVDPDEMRGWLGSFTKYLVREYPGVGDLHAWAIK